MPHPTILQIANQYDLTEDDVARLETLLVSGHATVGLRLDPSILLDPSGLFAFDERATDTVLAVFGDVDPDEVIETVAVPWDRVPELVREGQVRDAKSVASLLMAYYLYPHEASDRG